MGPAVVRAGDESIITTDAQGNLVINASSTGGDARVWINGVDVLQELAELREILLDHKTTPTTSTPSTTAAPTNAPVTYTGDIGCGLENVPSDVTHILGNVSLISCPLLTANDLLQAFGKLVQVSGDLTVRVSFDGGSLSAH